VTAVVGDELAVDRDVAFKDLKVGTQRT